jgi:hypothetical protein
MSTDRITFNFNTEEAKGTIEVEREVYGLSIYVNGKCMVMVDLYYFSPEAHGELANNEKLDQLQLVLYSGEDTEDELGYVSWKGHELAVKDIEGRLRAKLGEKR